VQICSLTQQALKKSWISARQSSSRTAPLIARRRAAGLWVQASLEQRQRFRAA
jgi:hypothetical protein